MVQRPSPESETRPPNFARVGSLISAMAVQVEQPRGDHAAAPPDLGDVGEIEVVLVVLGIAQRRRFGVDGMRASCRHWPRCRIVHALGIGGHHAVLDAVVHHLDEMAGAVGPAVQIALLGRAAGLLAARRARDVARAGRQGVEDRVEVLHTASSRRRSSCNSRARAPRRRRWCRRRRSGCPSASAPWRGGCRRCNRNCRRRSGCRPARAWGARSAMVLSTTAGGHHQPDGARLGQLRDELARATRRRSAPSCTRPARPWRDMSKTTH